MRANQPAEEFAAADAQSEDSRVSVGDGVWKIEEKACTCVGEEAVVVDVV